MHYVAPVCLHALVHGMVGMNSALQQAVCVCIRQNSDTAWNTLKVKSGIKRDSAAPTTEVTKSTGMTEKKSDHSRSFHSFQPLFTSSWYDIVFLSKPLKLEQHHDTTANG